MTFDASTPPAAYGTPVGNSTPVETRRPVFQKTLKTSIGCTGIGLHSGVRVAMKLHPAAPNTGIVFKRIDLIGGGATIKASWEHVADSRMCTVLADRNGISVATVEHLMSAFYGMEIDNVVVELNGPEVPAMDGSAEPFIFLIECAGVLEQDIPRRALRILKPHSHNHGNKMVALGPWHEGLRVDFHIDFHASAIGRQHCSFTVDPDTFRDELSRARTFGLLSDVTALREAGLARAERRRLAPRERIRAPQGPGCHRRPVPGRAPHHRALYRPLLQPRRYGPPDAPGLCRPLLLGDGRYLAGRPDGSPLDQCPRPRRCRVTGCLTGRAFRLV